MFVKPAAGWTNGTESNELTASDGATAACLGCSVAVSGDTVVAGAQYATVGGNVAQGAVYVFVEPASGWTSGTETAKLTASDAAATDFLGSSVAVSGDTVVAGAPYATVGANAKQGAAYVFVEPASGWTSGTESAKLTASDGAAGDFLGSVAVSGDTVVAGARGTNGSKGAAYVFVAKHPTSTSVSCSPTTVPVAQPTTCMATVTDIAASGASTPTGSVTFSSDTSGGSFSSSGPCDLSPTGTAGQASCSVSYTPGQVGSGSQTITASYGGDDVRAFSSASTTLTVTIPASARSTSTSMSCFPDTVPAGQPTTCTATVTDSATGTAITPTEYVDFSSSGGSFPSSGSCDLSPIPTLVGQAWCSLSYTPERVGSGSQITASYGGDSTHAPSSGSTTITVLPPRYVALGDSYSAGQGNPPFLSPTDGGGDPFLSPPFNGVGNYCHRSSAAYPELVSTAYATSLLFYACSGAVTADVTQCATQPPTCTEPPEFSYPMPFYYEEPLQITDPGVNATANLVTMTIGGNDAEFVPVLQACILQTLEANFVNNLIQSNPVLMWLGLGLDPSCAHSRQLYIVGRSAD